MYSSEELDFIIEEIKKQIPGTNFEKNEFSSLIWVPIHDSLDSDNNYISVTWNRVATQGADIFYSPVEISLDFTKGAIKKYLNPGDIDKFVDEVNAEIKSIWGDVEESKTHFKDYQIAIDYKISVPHPPAQIEMAQWHVNTIKIISREARTFLALEELPKKEEISEPKPVPEPPRPEPPREVENKTLSQGCPDCGAIKSGPVLIHGLGCPRTAGLIVNRRK